MNSTPREQHPEQHPTEPHRAGGQQAPSAVRKLWAEVQPEAARGRRFWSALSPKRRLALAGGGVVVAAVAAAVSLLALDSVFGAPTLPPPEQFAHDLAEAGVVSADPGVKARVNLPAGPESTAAIVNLATTVCADLNNGSTRDAVATELYQGALEGTLTGGVTLPYDDAATIVDLAIRDVCPGH